MPLSRKLLILFLMLMHVLTVTAIAQNRSEKRRGGVILGFVFDKKTSKPIEFATIMIHSENDNKVLTGGVTDDNGKYSVEGLPPGSYYAKISYIGLEAHQSSVFKVAGETKIDLGKVFLNTKEIGMKDVIVSADRVAISYQIDKKVINVGENFASLSGTAVDVLENVPSVTVDIDGNVSLRGSGNFTVLIDGRPTIMDGNTALQQIPATSIENIEIITNPSAKYDPEGTAGILNIVLKKDSIKGISGIAGLNGGLKDKYGAEFLGNYKTNGTQLNVGVNYNKRNMTSNETSNNWTNDGSVYSYYNSDGSSFRNNEHFSLRGSVALNFGEDKILTFGGRYSNRNSADNSTSNYSEWTSADPLKKYFTSKNNSADDGGEYQLSASYNHPFNKNGHELSIDLDFDLEDRNDVVTNNLMNGFNIVDGKKTSESGPGNELTSKIDYQLPLSEDSKFEAGYQGELELSNEITDLEIYNTNTKKYEWNALFSNDIKYYTNQFALYSIYSNKFGELGFKLGVRGEYTGREVKIEAKNQNFSLDQWDFFPTAHFSYDFGSGNQIMSSYTRRINRPHGWEFEPFLTWVDAYNVRMGNPSILPEYIDSYELGFQKVIGNSLFSLDSYYRVTNNKVDRIRSYYAENVTLQTPQNIGKDYALGMELFFNFDPIEKWNINLMGNLYNYKIEGRLNGIDFSRNSFNWSARFNNTIKISSATMIQLNAMYNSPTVSSQGNRKGYFSTNLAIKQNFFDRMITATLQIRDLFSASTQESTNESFDFYNYRYSQRESPMVMLNVRFNINNYKTEGREEGEENMDNGNGE